MAPPPLIILLLTLTLTSLQTIDPTLSTCPPQQFFDTTQFTCASCQSNTIQGASGKSCVCDPGFVIQASTRVAFAETCVKCPAVSVSFLKYCSYKLPPRI